MESLDNVLGLEEKIISTKSISGHVYRKGDDPVFEEHNKRTNKNILKTIKYILELMEKEVKKEYQLMTSNQQATLVRKRQRQVNDLFDNGSFSPWRMKLLRKGTRERVNKIYNSNELIYLLAEEDRNRKG